MDNIQSEGQSTEIVSIAMQSLASVIVTVWGGHIDRFFHSASGSFIKFK
ncbi:MAG: hypothetical protein HRT71_09770 [Flavobacteriales bacterium]|nr:hypothetical protein [Flavobacteriales bacterium]